MLLGWQIQEWDSRNILWFSGWQQHRCGSCFNYDSSEVWYQKMIFESYTLWVNFQVLVRTTVHFRRGIYNMGWSDSDMHICRIGFGVPYFFSHIRCSRVIHSTVCMEQVHEGGTELFLLCQFNSLCWHTYTTMNGWFQWFSFLILHTISMLQGMFDFSSKFNDILFDQTWHFFLPVWCASSL